MCARFNCVNVIFPFVPFCLLAGDLQRELPQAQLFINDRVDLACTLSTAGVHLRESSLPPAVVRRPASAIPTAGECPCISIDGALAAEQQGADFVVLGPIHDTPSKREAWRASRTVGAWQAAIRSYSDFCDRRHDGGPCTRCQAEAGAFGVGCVVVDPKRRRRCAGYHVVALRGETGVMMIFRTNISSNDHHAWPTAQLTTPMWVLEPKSVDDRHCSGFSTIRRVQNGRTKGSSGRLRSFRDSVKRLTKSLF